MSTTQALRTKAKKARKNTATHSKRLAGYGFPAATLYTVADQHSTIAHNFFTAPVIGAGVALSARLVAWSGTEVGQAVMVISHAVANHHGGTR